MRLLLDTHAFLWWIASDPALKTRPRNAIADSSNECFVSVASCWEISIRKSLGKLETPDPLESFLSEQLAANDFRLLGLDLRHVVRVAALPFHHRDPFDRLLVAQALEEKLAIVSADSVFTEYGVRRIW